MAKLFVYRPTPRATQASILAKAFIISVFFTAPIMYFFGIACRPSPRTIALAVRTLEMRKTTEFQAYNPPSTPTPSPTPSISPESRRRSFHKYDLLNDLHEGDDPAAASFIDTDNDLFLNGSLTPNNGTTLDEDTLIHGVTLGYRADWLTVTAYHKFCHTIMAQPIPAPNPLCIRGLSMECINGEQKNNTPFFARDAQDFYLHTKHFSFLNRSGVYFDIGTRHPVMGSPSYFFDACLRWHGICVEANPDVYQYIHRQRSCELVPTCLTQHDGTKVTFLMKAPHGGIQGHSLLHQSLINKTMAQGVMKTRLTCTNLAALSRRSNVKLIDLLTLDVDGQELDILKGIDFDHMLINVILVTTSNETLPGIESFLTKEGYVRHIPDLDNKTQTTGLLRNDAIFVHHDVTWGSPI